METVEKVEEKDAQTPAEKAYTAVQSKRVSSDVENLL